MASRKERTEPGMMIAADTSTVRLTPYVAATGAFLIALVLYLLTMNRTIGFIDKGEMAAAASTLGIAHPTGYPTMMLLGYLFTQIGNLFGLREILALNIMAALLTAGSVGVLTLLFHHLLGRAGSLHARSGKPATPASSKKGEPRGKTKATRQEPSAASPAAAASPLDPIAHSLLSAAAALLVGHSAIWWNQGNGIEVYSLHALLMPLVILFFLRYVDGESTDGKFSTDGRLSIDGKLFALTLGLSFTNHMTTILLAPAFLVYFFMRFGFDGSSLRRILHLAPYFLLGLLPYIWLPIRASMDPMFNWGDPDSLKRFIDHVSGRQYRVWMFSSADTFSRQTSYFLGSLPRQTGLLGLLVAAAGLAFAWRRQRNLVIWSALLLVTCIIYAGGYDIADIESYYMTAILAIGIWVAWGLRWIATRHTGNLALGVAALMVVANIALNYPASDESGNFMVEDYSLNMLESLPADALVFSAEWDTWVSAAWYLQGVEGVRRDVLVIDQELLRRSWYIDQLRNTFPAFMKSVEPEVERFLAQVYRFEHDEPYDPAAIQAAYIGMIDAMIDRNIAGRPVLMTREVDREMGSRYLRVPDHLALRLAEDTAYIGQTPRTLRYRPWQGRVDDMTARIHQSYALAMLGRSQYESRHGHDSLAAFYSREALRFDPGYQPDDVPNLPLDREERIHEVIRLFEQLRSMAPVVPKGS